MLRGSRRLQQSLGFFFHSQKQQPLYTCIKSTRNPFAAFLRRTVVASSHRNREEEATTCVRYGILTSNLAPYEWWRGGRKSFPAFLLLFFPTPSPLPPDSRSARPASSFQVRSLDVLPPDLPLLFYILRRIMRLEVIYYFNELRLKK